LFDFYKAQMPTFNWQEISSIRAAISVLTWQRGDRIATIQIDDTTLGAEVILTIGPVTGSSAASPPPPGPALTQPKVMEQQLEPPPK
jgi:hypothetical protein